MHRPQSTQAMSTRLSCIRRVRVQGKGGVQKNKQSWMRDRQAFMYIDATWIFISTSFVAWSDEEAVSYDTTTNHSSSSPQFAQLVSANHVQHDSRRSLFRDSVKPEAAEVEAWHIFGLYGLQHTLSSRYIVPPISLIYSLDSQQSTHKKVKRCSALRKGTWNANNIVKRRLFTLYSPFVRSHRISMPNE